MSTPGEGLIVYFIDQLVQEVIRKRELLGGVEDGLDLLERNLRVINASLKDSKREQDEGWMATKLEVINQMREIAFKAEHVIDKYIYHERMQKRRNLLGKSIHSRQLVDIAKTIAAQKTAMEEIDRNRGTYVQGGAQAQQQEEAAAVADHHHHHAQPQRSFDAVGLDDHANEWVRTLMSSQYSKREVLIMGMGGLGKSKLARKIYERIVAPGQHFDCWAWVHGSPEFKSRDWLVEILKHMMMKPKWWPMMMKTDWWTMDWWMMHLWTMRFQMKNNNGIHEMDDEKLEKTLKERLTNKRYLVVLDGIWNSSDELEAIKSAFPNDQNGSRILITSRGGDLTTFLPNQYCFLPLLNRDESWKLLCNRVFAGGRCDDEQLEVEGKELAADCKGLPLSIIELGQLLCRNVLPGSTHSVETWQAYKQHVNSVLIRKSTRCLSVLAQSYQRLPDAQSQSCFLYLSLFPEDFVYTARHLKQLWSDEGLILDDSPRDVLDVAEECLTNLINRSLIHVVSKDMGEAKVKTCGIHSILRELSKYKGEREKFVELRLDNERASSKERGRRLSVQGDILKHICSSDYDSSSARSLLLFNYDTSTCPNFDETKFWKRVSESFRYVRVLYLWKVPIKLIPDRIKNLIFLTNITILGGNNLEIDAISDFICNLELLETIDIDGHVRKCLPEIWKMKKLKHLRVSKGMRLPKPPKGLKAHSFLRILSGVVVEENMAHSVFTGVKKLHLVYVANKQNQQVIDAAKQKVDEARKKFEKAQKRAASLKIANKAQKNITKAEKEVKKAEDKVKEAEEKTVEAQEFKLRTDALKSLKDFSALKSLKLNGFEKFDENFDYKFPSTLEKITFANSYLDVDYLISILEKLNNLRILKVREHYGSNADQLRTGIQSRFPTLKVSI